MAQQTAIEWLVNNLPERFKNAIINTCAEEIEQAKQVELEQRKEDFKIGYSQGYLDAQVNHINDAENCINEREYINSKL
jgi:hypothetical protein